MNNVTYCSEPMGAAIVYPLKGEDQLKEQCILLKSHLQFPACQIFASIVVDGHIRDINSYFCVQRV